MADLLRLGQLFEVAKTQKDDKIPSLISQLYDFLLAWRKVLNSL